MQKYLNFIQKEREIKIDRNDFLSIWKEFKNDLNAGKIRVAFKDKENNWRINEWIKEFILLGFKYGKINEFEEGYIDKDTLGERKICINEKIRTVSPTTSIRDGVYIGKEVTFMPPNYTNIGAYIDDGSMIDSLVLVGSCAQIGKNVHIGAGTIIGGVLEPIGTYPVIIENEVFIGAGCNITEGTIIKNNVIIGAGTTITASTPIYDNVKGKIVTADEHGIMVVPENSIVVPGARKIKSEFYNDLSVETPIIIKYGGEIKLEETLRL